MPTDSFITLIMYLNNQAVVYFRGVILLTDDLGGFIILVTDKKHENQIIRQPNEGC